METTEKYENFPVEIVLLSNLVSFSIYVLGLFIIFRAGSVFLLFYLLYILVLEYRLLRNHCTDCYYWGKTCGFGKGRLSSLLFKKGDNSKFCIKDMLPDILVTLIPVVAGVILLVLKFDLIILSALIILLLLTTAGNGFIRGNLTCKYCKQRELGCPAELLFNKSETP